MAENEEKTKYDLTVEEFANTVDLSPSYIRKLIANAKIQTKMIKHTKYIPLGNGLMALYKFYKELYDGKENQKDKGQLQNQLLEANIKYKNTQTELQEMKRDIQSGRYLLTENAQQELKDFLSLLRNLYISIPAMMMSEIENELKKDRIREVQHKLENKINKIFSSYVDSGRVIEEVMEKGKVEINEAGEIKKKRGRAKK